MIKPFRGDFPITQTFGVNKESYSKFGLQGHNGIDYALPMGTDVVSPHKGKVIEAAFDEGGYGLYLKIENDKEGSVLGHLSEHYVSVGTELMEGALIAKSGNTGNSTGPHLHHGWYMKPRDRSNGFNGFENQLLIFKAIKEKYFELVTDVSDIVKKLQVEMDGKLALKEQECKQKLQDIRDKITNFVKNL